MTDSMDGWTSFLEQQGIDAHGEAALDAAGHAPRADFQAPPVTDFMVPLIEYGLLAATGEDAATFLHNQLTNDVLNLGASQARLAGYCSPKGRLLATLLIWKTDDAIMLQLPCELQPALQKRLQMFILRAKAKLVDAGSALVQIGLAGDAATTVLAKWFPALPPTPYGKVDGAFGTLVRLPDSAAIVRYLWALPPETARSVWPDLRAVLAPATANAWRLSEIRAGIPQITAPIQEKFVPQMINFEAVGGVNFQKGCYPGQEIVARSQYLGKLKRRMLPATVAAGEIAAGTEIFSSDDAEQACGMVVSAARIDAVRAACLVEIKLAACDTEVHLGAIDGPLLEFQALPYALADAERPELR